MPLPGHTLRRVNTTALISNWSMAGARSELERRFGSAPDIVAAVAESLDRGPVRIPAAPLMVKPAGEGEWRPLAADA